MQVTYKGKKYKSIASACDFLGISPEALCRNYKGVPIEQAIDRTLENKKKIKHNCTDHLGRYFESKKAMAEFYNIPRNVLCERLRSHWDLKRALTTPTIKGNSCTDHLGHRFESVMAMAKFYNIPYIILYKRLYYYKWSLERALTTPNGKPRGKHAGKIQGQKI